MGKSKKKGGSSAVEDDFEVIEKTELLDDEATATEGQGSKKAAGKKGRKAKKEAELEEAQKELEALNDDPECEVPAAQTTTAKSGKKGTKKAKAVAKDDPSDQEDSDEGEGSGKSKAKKGGFALLMEGDDSPADDSQSDDEENKPAKKATPKKSAKPAKKSAFELMAEMEGDSNDDDQGSDQDNESKEDKKKAGEKKNNKKDKKKKGKTNKKDGGDEDELAAALADLGIEAGAEEDEKAKKKKEKKAKQKQKQVEAGEDGEGEAPSEAVAEEGTGASKKSKKKKKGGKDEAQTGGAGEEAKEPEAEAAADGKKKAGKKGPGSKMKEALKEALKKQQEEEERLRQEEEEKQRKAEEAEKARLEKKRLEAEEKERKKQAKKDRIDEMKRQGTYLTPKQREEKARNEAFLAAMKAQGLEVPNKDEKKGPRLGTRVRGPKNWKGKSETPEPDTKAEDKKEEEAVKVEIVDESKKGDAKGEESDEVADAWDASSDESDTEDKKESEVETKEVKADVKNEASQNAKEAAESDGEDSESEDESDDDDDEEDESDSDDESEDEEDKAQIAMNRIARRREANEKARTTDDLRAPVVCVLGHVDTGKTKILDKLRRTNVQDGEAGGITQQIGATNVPKEVIQEQCKMVKGFPGIKVPGLLIIDTPGHESFSNLRDRGSSLCDIAILVVDIMHGLEPQTIESINLLKKKKTPFVIALNKVDRLYQWKSNRHKDIQDVVTSQEKNTILEFKKRSNEVIASIAEQGLNAALCYENPDPKSYISMVPTSAHSGEGMGNLMGLLVTLSQTRLAQRLAYSEELQATVLEVKAIPGYGTTIDICLVNGRLKEGATMILAGTEGPVVTSAKALLTPAKMQDLRVKNNYVEHKEIRAAQGVKIVAKELDKAIAGLNLLVANHPDEVQICKDEIAARLSSAINSIKVKDRGVFVQASTLGSLEALLEFLRTSKIPYAGVKIGPVVKKDVMKASVMLEHEPKYTIILAFDVKVEKDAQEMADKEGVKIFQADIIYHLFDRFVAYQDELKAKKKEEFRNVAVFPCKLKMMPNCIFNSRDPIVAGVIVEGGIVRTGTPLCVPSKDFVEIGVITSIQSNHKEQETARKGEEVCIKVEPVPGEAPKMFGRHFDENDMVVSKISRTSIDACKEYFRDDLQKSDWQLMIELKKTFEIL